MASGLSANPSPWEMEARESGIQAHLQLCMQLRLDSATPDNLRNKGEKSNNRSLKEEEKPAADSRLRSHGGGGAPRQQAHTRATKTQTLRAT